MAAPQLILTIPQGAITATSLGVEGLALHRSPGSGKHFHGRKILVELATQGAAPDFVFLDEGGWRDSVGDTRAALEAVAGDKRTKTALSNNAFSVTPLEAYQRVYLTKTGGEVMAMAGRESLHQFAHQTCEEGMPTSQVAAALGLPTPAERKPRLYLVMCPVELLLFSNLSPAEYAWYATHRPGKIFRQLAFTELKADQPQLAAFSRFADARSELAQNPDKKTKTVVSDDCLNTIPFNSWLGYDDVQEGGLYVADRSGVSIWRFPEEIPRTWERASG